MKQTPAIIILVLIVIALGYFFLMQNKGIAENIEETPQNTTSNEVGNGTAKNDALETPDTADTSGVSEQTRGEMQITYTDNGFEPASVTVALGTTVVFVNEGSGQMWVGSDIHPTHSLYHDTTLRDHCPDTEGVAFDQCGIGKTYSFTFEKTGEWGYHNHINALHTGTVVVVAE